MDSSETISPLLELPNTYRAFYGGFSHLNSIQKQTIRPILHAQDLILQSPTGSGKTEAVMAPVIERLIQSQYKHSIIYLVPTKALAIDLKRRMQHSISDKLGLSMGIRTGDIKQAGGDNPDLIITTPESFDVMIGSKNSHLRHFIKRLGTVLIDEAHSLIYNYRGEQLRALLRRLDLKTNHRVQKIALSATMGDLQQIALFFRFSANTVKIKSQAQRKIIPHLVSLKSLAEITSLLEDLRSHWKYQKILVFVNNRGRCDELLALLEPLESFKGQVRLHYSNLKTSERHVVEKWFRTAEKAVCIATSTLELGIDIGNVDGVVLFEPPDSVAGFVQRIGRANRKKNHVHFWGICQGENAGHQLLRFLAFLTMSYKNTMEQQNPKQLNSVYFQQILSCCYEKQQLSLQAMLSLFSDNKELLTDIFNHMSKKYWLKETKNKGLFSGAKGYYDYLLEYKIWSNFPETAEEYVLELEGESIADIPLSLVKQLDIGDTVLLAGKHVKIILIEDIPYKRVVVVLNQQQQDNKEIFWIGRGSHLSYDVAQEIKDLLQTPSKENKTDLYKQQLLKGLFRRPQQLFEQLIKEYQHGVILENKIVVSRTITGCFRYWTFLGSIGNLILQRSIEKQLESEDLVFNTSADDTAIECSQFVDLQKLVLPKSENEFKKWCYSYQSILRSIFSLNSFARFLPKQRLLEELNSFLYEPRLIKHFIDYQQLSCNIIQGDTNFFFVEAASYQPESTDKPIIYLPDSAISLLELEKQRYKNSQWKPFLLNQKLLELPVVRGRVVRGRSQMAGTAGFSINSEFLPFDSAPCVSKRITGTLLANYIRHQQCKRWLVFNFSDPNKCPIKIETIEQDRSIILEQGLQHEKNCLKFLQNKGNTIISIDSDNQSLEQRFQQTCQQLISISTQLSQSSDNKTIILDQAVLIHPFSNTDTTENGNLLDAIGIPDLIRISRESSTINRESSTLNKESSTVVWEIGDIKNSRKPQYYQKWQVAFYTFLLTQLKDNWIKLKLIDFPIEISTRGLLITANTDKGFTNSGVSPLLDDWKPSLHFFDLIPFYNNFPILIQQIETVLLTTESACHFQLNTHCNSCPWYSYCYQQALTEDIYLFSDLSRGLLEKFTLSDIKNFEQVNSFFSTQSKQQEQSEKVLTTHGDIFDTIQTEHVKQQLVALKNNSIIIKSPSTRLFPNNISAIIFIHSSLNKNTLNPTITANNTHDITSFSWQIMELNGQLNESGFWPKNNLTLESFLNDLWDTWSNLVDHHSGPHIFHYGCQSWDILQHYTIDPLWKKNEHYHTDIQQLLKTHYYLPIPGNLSLASLHYLLNPGKFSFSQLVSFFQIDELSLKPNLIFELYAKIYTQLISQLNSLYRQISWKKMPAKLSTGDLFVNFINKEKELRESDIIDCQQGSLEQRIAKYRAIGPIIFKSSHLDNEGFFLYSFNMPNCLTKFRKGDFLKLVLIGVSDLQQGSPVIIESINPYKQELILKSRQVKLSIKQQASYSLEEDLTDFSSGKLLHICEQVFNYKQPYPVNKILQGERLHSTDSGDINQWVEQTQTIMGLNQKQSEALKLPFNSNLTIIEGPPGTGKTHLLGWILIALFLQAKRQNKPLRIVVSALTHQAIDHVLNKVISLANNHYPDNFPAVCAKWGRSSGLEAYDQQRQEDVHFSTNRPYQVFAMQDKTEVTTPRYLLLGATGFGCYQLFNAKQTKGEENYFPAFFDYVVFDEASQVLIPQALLSLIYAKGNFIFLGDSKQLPPIIKDKDVQTTKHANANNKPLVHQSILDYLVSCSADDVRITLNTTYRMNQEICEFPGKFFYQQQLSSGVANKRLNLAGFTKDDTIDDIIDPEKPVTLLLLDHRGYHQQCLPEVNKIIEITQRLVCEYKVTCDDIAIIAPHRAQNNAIRHALQQNLKLELEQLPLIDTVERIQGAEREIIIFSLTTSDEDYIENEFLNNPNRFNVAITRAKTKLIIIASEKFFKNIAHNEEALINNHCFKSFLEYCRKNNCIFG